MAKYLFAYHGGSMPESEEEQQAVMAAWGNWFQELGPAIADGGNPTGRAVTVAGDGSVSEGGGANPVTGYSLIDADSVEAAAELAKGCPVLSSGGSVEVAETVDVTV